MPIIHQSFSVFLKKKSKILLLTTKNCFILYQWCNWIDDLDWTEMYFNQIQTQAGDTLLFSCLGFFFCPQFSVVVVLQTQAWAVDFPLPWSFMHVYVSAVCGLSAMPVAFIDGRKALLFAFCAVWCNHLVQSCCCSTHCAVTCLLCVV